jgi:DNA-binding transcriptional MerR regulator
MVLGILVEVSGILPLASEMTASSMEIPNRSLFRQPEVCEIAQVQPYVLRSWEAEFPDLGVAKTAGGPRVYRRADLERVLRLKHLLFVEGLTLAGARRKLEAEAAPGGADVPAELDALLGTDVRERLMAVKRGLRDLQQLLAAEPIVASAPESFTLEPDVAPVPVKKKGAAKKRRES